MKKEVSSQLRETLLLLSTNLTAVTVISQKPAFAVADLEEGPGPSFLDQTEARRAENPFLWRPGTPYLRV